MSTEQNSTDSSQLGNPNLEGKLVIDVKAFVSQAVQRQMMRDMEVDFLFTAVSAFIAGLGYSALVAAILLGLRADPVSLAFALMLMGIAGTACCRSIAYWLMRQEWFRKRFSVRPE